MGVRQRILTIRLMEKEKRYPLAAKEFIWAEKKER